MMNAGNPRFGCFVSTGTVITHQSSLYAKLGVHSRAGLLAALLSG
jgi:DNA-binding CsgD family transcriptional regulator